jgi:hypothetical protein
MKIDLVKELQKIVSNNPVTTKDVLQRSLEIIIAEKPEGIKITEIQESLIAAIREIKQNPKFMTYSVELTRGRPVQWIKVRTFDPY